MKSHYTKVIIITILLEFYISNFLFLNLSNKNCVNNKNNISQNLVFRDLYSELSSMQNYIDIVFNYTLIDKGKKFYLHNNPKISIVMSIYNGEAFIKRALLSIQNQDFKDIEIVMVDDCSKDNSLNLIKELMVYEPRITLYQNEENRGALFTKVKGILLAKGKYIMVLDEDDIFVQRNAFSTLYKEAEKNNLDILSFGMLMSKIKINIIRSNSTKPEPPIIYQPELGRKMFHFTKSGDIVQEGGTLVNYFIKKSIYEKAIKQLDEKYLRVKINVHDDFFVFYLLIKSACSYKEIDKFFYLVIMDWDINEPAVKFRTSVKYKERANQKCFGYFNFMEFILNKTENTYYDKKLAFFNYKLLLLNNQCRNNTKYIEKAINISYLYLENKYILEEDKNEIRKFINEKKQKVVNESY